MLEIQNLSLLTVQSFKSYVSVLKKLKNIIIDWWGALLFIVINTLLKIKIILLPHIQFFYHI